MTIKNSQFTIRIILLCICLCLGTVYFVSAGTDGYTIKICSGEASETIEYLKSKNFWGAQNHDRDLTVPRIIFAVVDKRWRKDAQQLTVTAKKELFYRTILPLILLNNELISKERQRLVTTSNSLRQGLPLTSEKQTWLSTIAKKYGMPESTDPEKQIAELLRRVDTIPSSLALGQTAYESGYGTSRFAIEGNALFGQWTYVGGMKPEEHRASKGNYGVAAYDWPFDSVKGYMLNLNTHKAYQTLRDKRDLLRKQGKDITGLDLVTTLDKYSERGTEYVKTLQSIIKVNDLAVADNARLRHEPVTLIVEVGHADNIVKTETEVEQLRISGELDRIIKNMHLDE